MQRSLKAITVLSVLTALVIIAAPAVYAQMQNPAGTYFRSFTGAQGPVDMTMNLSPDGTATITTNYGPRGTVTQTGIWTARPSYTTNATWVYVFLNTTDGRPVPDRMVFALQDNRLYGMDFNRAAYGSSLMFNRTRMEPTGAGLSTGVISGTVTYRERMALTPGAAVTVRLIDTAMAGFPGAVVAEQVILNPGQAPIPFTLRYNPQNIIPGHRYVVESIITQNGQLLYRNAQEYPVITMGNPVNLDMTLNRVQ